MFTIINDITYVSNITAIFQEIGEEEQDKLLIDEI